MSGRAISYIGGGRCRQSPFVRIAAVLSVTLTLGGCAGMGLPFGEAAENRSAQPPARALLASASTSVVDRVDPSDWETIRRTVAGVSDATANEATWFNPDTGSTGTVGVAPATQTSGTLCRPFATTINDTRGVRRYRGDACLRTDGRWQLHGIAADDVLLS